MGSLTKTGLVLCLLQFFLVVATARSVKSHKDLARAKRSNHGALERDLRFKGKGKGSSSDCIPLSSSTKSSTRRNLREISSSKGKGSVSNAPSVFCSEEPSPSPTLSPAPTASEAPTGTGKSGKGGTGKSGKSSKGKSGTKGKGSSKSSSQTKSPSTATPTLQPSVSPTTSSAPSGPTEAPSSAPSGPTTSPSDTPTQAPSEVSCEVRLERLLDISVEELVDEIFLDIKGNGRSPGDVYVFEGNPLTDTFQSEQRGVSNGRCVVLEDDSFDENVYCAMEFAYPEGSILAQGFFGQMMIVGGTGCYENVQGYLIPTASTTTTTSFIFDIQENDSTCIDSTSLFQFPWFEVGPGVFVDWDNAGPTVGDIYVFDSNEFANSATFLQGTVEGECILVKDTTDHDKSFCMVTFNTFLGDKLTAQGIYENMVITGGTSCFFGASGAVEGSKNSGRGTSFTHNVKLQFPGDPKPPTCPPAGIFENPWTGPLIGQSIDYGGDGDSGGDLFVLDASPLSILSLSVGGTQTGRCAFLDTGAAQQYCNIVVSLGPDGQIALQGYFNEMTIVGGSGCFGGLKGTVAGDNSNPNQVEYTWSIVDEP